MPISLKAEWVPHQSVLETIDIANKAVEDTYSFKVDKETKEAYFDAVKDRINVASRIKSRKFEDLREEERIVVYRKLIKSLLHSVSTKNNNSVKRQHMVSEVINSIFDIKKMLYFVSPDYWKPKHNNHKQTFESLDDTFHKSRGSFKLEDAVVGWGGANLPENYYITDESDPAKLGSSLGWLMQLDGDNMRNAFLNAPWVKAVMPIRPGKEKEAIAWLKEVEGFDDTADYKGAEEENIGKSLGQVLDELAQKITNKHKKSSKVDKFPSIDDDNQVSSTPLNKVYEYGFYPLKGGFKAQTTEDFEIFDQWLEVLPTDQIAPVEVDYDPKTGMQI